MAKPVKKAAAAVKKTVKPAGKTKPAPKTSAKSAPKKAVAKAVKPTAKVNKAPVKPVAKKPGMVSKLVKSAIGAGKKIIAKATGKPAVKPAASSKPAAKPVQKAPLQPIKSASTKAEAAKPVAAKPMPSFTPTPDARATAARSGNVAKAYAVAKAVAVPPKPGKKTVAAAPARKQEPIAVRVDLPKGYKPSRKEPYMGAHQQEYFRQKLSNWRAELVEESKQTIDNLRDEVRDVGDEAERATRETENSLELRTRDRYRKLISKIDDGLRRLDEGAYGYCVDTGDEIGLDRLEARPTAERTVDAQERWEHRQKQMGE
jgi:DnaK suppressor protein